MIRHLLDVDDLTTAEVEEILARAADPEPSAILVGQTVGLIFEKPSTRTRHSTEAAAVQLGAHPVSSQGLEVGLGTREPVADVARTLSSYHALLGARVFGHGTVEQLAAASSVPVVNLLSDDAHPLQALADLLTLRTEFGHLDGLIVAYVGDPNNVFRSLALAAARTGMVLRLAAPAGHPCPPEWIDRIRAAGMELEATARPDEAVKGVDAVYADTWTSMGREAEAERRRRSFEGFTVDQRLMDLAAPHAVFLHCLPAHRGEEVSAEVIDGHQSRIWPQATNRMHAARGALWWLLDQLGDRTP